MYPAGNPRHCIIAKHELLIGRRYWSCRFFYRTGFFTVCQPVPGKDADQRTNGGQLVGVVVGFQSATFACA